jgi:hypothetical protein
VTYSVFTSAGSRAERFRGGGKPSSRRVKIAIDCVGGLAAKLVRFLAGLIRKIGYTLADAFRRPAAR